MYYIGIIGACEDQDEHEIRAQFTTNLIGSINIFQLTLPYFRARSRGMYVVFSSTAGTLGIPGLGRMYLLSSLLPPPPPPSYIYICVSVFCVADCGLAEEGEGSEIGWFG